MHQLLAEPVSDADDNYCGPVKKSAPSYDGLNSPHTAAGSLPSHLGLSVGIGDFVRFTNVPHGDSKSRSLKAERKEYEEKLARDLIMGRCPWFDQGSCNLYDLKSSAASPQTHGFNSITFEHFSSSDDDEMSSDACKPERYPIPVVVENMNVEFKTDATCVSHEFRLVLTDDGSTSSSEECIPLVVEKAEARSYSLDSATCVSHEFRLVVTDAGSTSSSEECIPLVVEKAGARANSLDPGMACDVIPAVVENLFDDFCHSAMPVVSTATLPSSLVRFGDETNATPHATATLLPIKSRADRLILSNVSDQREENLPSCVVEIETNDTLAYGCSTDRSRFGFDSGWIVPEQCVDGGALLPTVLNFVECSPVPSSPDFNVDFSCALQSDPSFAAQAPFMDISWQVQDVPAAQPLVAHSLDCSPFLQHWHRQPTQAAQLQWSDTKKKNKWPQRVAAGSPKRKRLAGRTMPEWAPFTRETARAAGDATAYPSTSALQPSSWHAPSGTATPYWAADSAYASGLQNGSIATCRAFPFGNIFGYVV